MFRKKRGGKSKKGMAKFRSNQQFANINYYHHVHAANNDLGSAKFKPVRKSKATVAPIQKVNKFI